MVKSAALLVSLLFALSASAPIKPGHALGQDAGHAATQIASVLAR